MDGNVSYKIKEETSEESEWKRILISFNGQKLPIFSITSFYICFMSNQVLFSMINKKQWVMNKKTPPNLVQLNFTLYTILSDG